MAGFAVAEVGARRLVRHWLRGGFPRSFLARSEADSLAWRREFVSTFLERDLPQLAASVPSSATTLLRFWSNARPLPRRGVEGDGLRGVLGPGREDRAPLPRYLHGRAHAAPAPAVAPNLGKRQVKSPKVYLRDSGLLHHLLGIGEGRG